MKEIIDFAQWYSGMDREKVVAAYRRFLKETMTDPGGYENTNSDMKPKVDKGETIIKAP